MAKPTGESSGDPDSTESDRRIGSRNAQPLQAHMPRVCVMFLLELSTVNTHHNTNPDLNKKGITASPIESIVSFKVGSIFISISLALA